MKWRVVMLRKVAVFIVSAGLMISPLSVQALGFGGVKLKSSLNEKLNAEVALLSASTNDVQSLTINLATEEAFLRSGIDRTALLNTLKFKVKQNANGDYYIHVTTTETVREPFMNFLLELNWKNGRMLREYTMLINPPHHRTAPRQIAELAPDVAEIMALKPEPAAEQPVAVTESPAEPVAVTELEMVTEAEPIFEEIEPEYAMAVEATPDTEIVTPDIPVEEFASTGEEAVAEEVMETMEAAEVTEVTEVQVFSDDVVWPSIPLSAFVKEEESSPVPTDVSPVTAERGEFDYGITKENDNLWNIAEKLRQGDESISVYQVMMALLQSNPDAFIDNNVHRLKVGHVLRIDDPAALTSIGRKEAANSFIEQTESWNRYRQQVAGTTGVQPIMAGGNVAEAEVATADTTGELTLSSPDGESLTAGGGANEETLSNDLATMQDQLRQAKSDAGTMRTRNVALNDKLQSLEDELNRLQRSLSVKDDELAALQHQLSNLDLQPAEAPVQKQAAVKEESPVVAPVAETPAVAKEAAKPEVTKPTQAKVETPKAKVEPVAVPEVTNTEPSIMDSVTGIMDTVMGVIASIAATATGIVAGLNLGNDTLLFVAAPILLVFLIILMVVIKRRRQGDSFQESILTGAATASAEDGMQSGDSTTFSEESSFLSDFAMSGASAIDADDSEVDPLTEADVFMAYGRYEAAEERLTEAVQSDPTRMELRAKLLELHHATQNKAAFEAAAEDFFASLSGNEAGNPLWEKVVSMGTEIAPENPLFSQGGGADVPAASDIGMDDLGLGMTDSQVMDIGLETGVFAAADSGGATEAPADDMDFNLDLGDSAAASESPDMDFNLDIGGDASAEEPAADMDFNLDMGTTESATDDGGLDFNLDMGTADAAAEEPAADLDLSMDMETSESADDGGLDFDLNIGGDDTADAGLDFDAGSLDLNLDDADADISGGDEVGTKLDLAKAYIDMGDPEGARSILDEVMDEGSSTQKEEAQSLLGQIA